MWLIYVQSAATDSNMTRLISVLEFNKVTRTAITVFGIQAQ